MLCPECGTPCGMKSRASERWSLSWFACSACGWEERVTVQPVNEEESSDAR